MHTADDVQIEACDSCRRFVSETDGLSDDDLAREHVLGILAGQEYELEFGQIRLSSRWWSWPFRRAWCGLVGHHVYLTGKHLADGDFEGFEICGRCGRQWWSPSNARLRGSR